MAARETRLKSTALNLGRIPFWLKQKSLVTVTGQTFRPGGFILTRRAADFCNFSRKDRILDAGCGHGMTLRYLKDTFKINATGVDPDPAVSNAASGRLKSSALISLVRAGLPRLPFRSGLFNGIFCECVLSLVKDREACLEDLYRVMAPNGRLVLTDLYIRRWQVPQKPRSVKAGACLDGAVSMTEMLTEVEQAGFKVDIVEDHSGLLSQLGMPKAQKTGYCMIIAAKY
ncbi:MAG: methyltransferase domain-containing protein [Desulfobacterales bacterium]|nr:methyltransferase domain-containing protein [Desulfobacterales bacterium]